MSQARARAASIPITYSYLHGWGIVQQNDINGFKINLASYNSKCQLVHGCPSHNYKNKLHMFCRSDRWGFQGLQALHHARPCFSPLGSRLLVHRSSRSLRRKGHESWRLTFPHGCIAQKHLERCWAKRLHKVCVSTSKSRIS